MARAIILLMDSFGIGGAPDAEAYGSLGANTLGHVIAANGGLKIPNLIKLGLLEAAKETSAIGYAVGEQPESNAFDNLPVIKYGHACEISMDKDTVSGHWELAGLPNLNGWGHFPPKYPSFPAKMIKQICAEGDIEGILGNKAASGTVIIQELGEEHLKTGKPIFYTSADSNLQIAAHEERFGLERLYKLCETAYEYVKPYNIGRIIARPFVGEKAGEFVRTKNRRDYTAQPFGDTLLDRLKAAGAAVIGIGAINDIFAHRGFTKQVHAAGLDDLWNATLREVSEAPNFSLVFANFEDFDMYYGHRRNPRGYAACLEQFDRRLPELLPLLQDDDIVFITADHGNDPVWSGTDHTREQVPVLMFSKNKKLKGGNIGRRETYADIGQTIASYFKIDPLVFGKSFL